MTSALTTATPASPAAPLCYISSAFALNNGASVTPVDNNRCCNSHYIDRGANGNGTGRNGPDGADDGNGCSHHSTDAAQTQRSRRDRIGGERNGSTAAARRQVDQVDQTAPAGEKLAKLANLLDAAPTQP